MENMEDIPCGSKVWQARDLSIMGKSLDANMWKDEAGIRLPYLRDGKLPNHTLFDYCQNEQEENIPSTGQQLALCRAELEIQPEVILRNLLTLPDMQQFIPLQADTEPLDIEWRLAPLDFELVLDRDPFTNTSGGWREVDTSGFEMDAHSSGSLNRQPTGMDANFVRGSITQMPFTPSGMEDTVEDKLKFLELTPKQIEEGRDWVRQVEKLSALPPDFVESQNDDLKAVMNPKAGQVTELDFEGSFNGIADLLDEREMGLVKKLRGLSSALKTSKPARQNMQADNLRLLEMSGYGDIYRELKPEQFFENNTEGKNVLKISSLNDLTSSREWAVKVDVSVPVHDFTDRVPNMAHKYPFELDTFQKRAVVHLENHESVFVAAHTSAGKTVVAEYAIALSLRAKSRCVYTSPIKALSNQKYRDFKRTFGDVGLLTGDVQIEPSAHCLVMTTEILRSMLYRGSEIVRDLDWVIFDEVHYINDSERGVVWEEILIMLPSQVGIVMLSATVPNAVDFANWIGRIKQRKIYVISTPKRPVPLEHHLYVCVGSKTIDKDLIIVNTKGELQTANHASAIAIQKEFEKKNNIRNTSSSARLPPKQDKTVWLAFMDYIQQKELMPVIAFVFSRNRCDELGDMVSSLDLTTQKEKHLIKSFFWRAVSRLNESDRELPQIKRLEYYLERGVGIHHSGILPILKEAVEMLFQEGVVKILFATETFAMGVNMPARTVVFDSTNKHDGLEFRDLRPGEYIQMSGRAGRRGLDKTGNVIILCKMARIPDISKLQQMILGVPMKLESQFRLTYGMILQLLRIGTISITDMMKRSFSEYANSSKAPQHQEALDKLTKTFQQPDEEVNCEICQQDIKHYYTAYQACKKLRAAVNSRVFSLDNKLLFPGRLVTRCSIDAPVWWAIIVGCPPRQPNEERMLDVLEFVSLDDVESAVLKRLDAREIHNAVNAVVKVDANAIRSSAEAASTNNKSAMKLYRELKEKAAAQIAAATKSRVDVLTPLKDFKMTDMDLVDQWDNLVAMEASLKSYDCIRCLHFYDHMKRFSEKMEHVEEVARLRHLLSNESLQFLPEYRERVEVLKELRYVDQNNTVTLRGRVACEVSTSEYDLLVAECMFANVFTEREPAEIAALLSGLVFQGKTKDELIVPPLLEEGIDTMKAIAVMIGIKQREAGMKQATSQMADQLNFGLADVVYNWCGGMKFVDITKMTDVQEGIIVRTMTRLDEVCKNVKNSAKIFGNTRLVDKMEAASKSLKRDIAFVGSLYTSD